VAQSAHAPGRCEEPRERLQPAGQDGDRDQQAGDHPDRPLEHVAEHERRPVAHENRGEQESEAADRADRDGNRGGERDPVVNRDRNPVEDPDVDEADRERVHADRGDRDADRENHRPERCGGGDEELEDAELSLCLKGSGALRRRRRPDPHHARSESRDEQRLPLAVPEQEVGERCEDQR
jgi:hypothetical protein